MIKGCDISVYQGNVDFHALKDNLDFVIIRSTYGNGYVDKNFSLNQSGARNVGLALGYYHFAYPQYNTPEDEATWFSKIVSCQPGEIIALDFEESCPNPVDWCKRWLDKVSSNMGFKPLLYINLSTAHGFDWSPVIKAGYGLWLAVYDNDPVNVPGTAWPLTAMKQWTSKGNVAGLTPLDLDSFYGDVTAFKKYGNPPPVVTPPVVTPPVVVPPVESPVTPPSQPGTPAEACPMQPTSYYPPPPPTHEAPAAAQWASAPPLGCIPPRRPRHTAARHAFGSDRLLPARGRAAAGI